MQSMEESECVKFYEKYMYINKFLLKSVGLWPKEAGKKDSYLRRMVSVFYILLLLSLTLTQFHLVYLLWGNLFDCLEVLCNTTTSFLIIQRAAMFLSKRDIIVDFEAQNRRMWVTEFRDPSNASLMIDDAKSAQKLTYAFFGLVIFTITNFFFAPAIHILYQWKSGVPPTEFVYVLPYLVNLPLDLHQPLQHAIGYIPVAICSFSLIFYIAGIDAFYCSAIQHLVLYLKLLQRSLVEIQSNEPAARGEGKTVWNHLRRCIKKHQVIIKHSAVLESIYSPIILGLGVIGTLSMCMVIFHAVVTKGGRNGNIVLFLMYLSMEFFEIFLYCWFGNSLIHASFEVGSALYSTNWYDIHRDEKAFAISMQVMMIRTQRPIKLTAYKFADVSLTLFTRILSTTSSYFALLKSLYRD